MTTRCDFDLLTTRFSDFRGGFLGTDTLERFSNAFEADGLDLLVDDLEDFLDKALLFAIFTEYGFCF